jgi:esterase
MLKPMDGGGFTWRYDHAGIAATRLRPDPARLVDLAGYVRRIDCPALVLRGGRSDYLQPAMAEAMCAANPRIQWREIDGAGHYVHDDQPEAFCREVRAFLGLADPV